MRLSRGQIRKRIGQELAVAYSYRHSKEYWPEVGERRSGTTADMIVSVLEWLQECPDCYVAAYSMAYATQLVRQVKDHAETLGLDHSRIRPTSFDNIRRGKLAGNRAKVFYDHYTGQESFS